MAGKEKKPVSNPSGLRHFMYLAPMQTEFELVGLSKPMSATLQLPHTDSVIFWANFKMAKQSLMNCGDIVRGIGAIKK